MDVAEALWNLYIYARLHTTMIYCVANYQNPVPTFHPALGIPRVDIAEKERERKVFPHWKGPGADTGIGTGTH